MTAENVERSVLEVAARAPSVHNTQPWRLVAQPDGFELWAERSRQLPVLDPTGRQLVMSCGAALHHALVAARAAGSQPDVSPFPDSGQPDLLARVRLAQGAPATELELRLLEATRHRHTYRDRFSSEALPGELLEELLRPEVLGQTSLRVVSDPTDAIALEVLLARADAEQRADPAYFSELQEWTRAAPETGFGIPATNLDPTGGAGSSFALRHFEDLTQPVVTDPPVADHPTIAVLITTDDTPLDWLSAGQALSALLLHSSLHGVAAQPLGQVTDKVAWRRRLADALGLVGSPQLVLRLGLPLHDVPATPRQGDVTT